MCDQANLWDKYDAPPPLTKFVLLHKWSPFSQIVILDQKESSSGIKVILRTPSNAWVCDSVTLLVSLFLLYTQYASTQSKRGAGYSQVELDSLLDLLEKHLPISGIKLERVEMAHKIRFSAEHWNWDSLKQNLQHLYRTKMPTGNPFIPVNMR